LGLRDGTGAHQKKKHMPEPLGGLRNNEQEVTRF